MTSLKSGSAHHLAYSIPPMKNCGDIYILFGCLLSGMDRENNQNWRMNSGEYKETFNLKNQIRLKLHFTVTCDTGPKQTSKMHVE